MPLPASFMVQQQEGLCLRIWNPISPFVGLKLHQTSSPTFLAGGQMKLCDILDSCGQCYPSASLPSVLWVAQSLCMPSHCLGISSSFTVKHKKVKQAYWGFHWGTFYQFVKSTEPALESWRSWTTEEAGLRESWGLKLGSLFTLLLLFFQTVYYYLPQSGLKLPSSCRCPPSAGIAGIYHHAWIFSS